MDSKRCSGVTERLGADLSYRCSICAIVRVEDWKHCRWGCEIVNERKVSHFKKWGAALLLNVYLLPLFAEINTTGVCLPTMALSMEQEEDVEIDQDEMDLVQVGVSCQKVGVSCQGVGVSCREVGVAGRGSSEPVHSSHLALKLEEAERQTKVCAFALVHRAVIVHLVSFAAVGQ